MRQKGMRAGLSWLAFVGFMMLFQPTNLPVVVLIVPFILLFMCLYSTWMFISAFWEPHGYGNASTRKKRRAGILVCTSLVLLTVLQSLGQLTVKDSLTVVGLVVMSYFYSARFRTDTKGR